MARKIQAQGTHDTVPMGRENKRIEKVVYGAFGGFIDSRHTQLTSPKQLGMTLNLDLPVYLNSFLGD